MLPSSGQSALHLLAAGGSYRWDLTLTLILTLTLTPTLTPTLTLTRWDSAKGTIVRHPRAMVHDGRVMYTRVNHIAPEDARMFADLLRGHFANLRLRDANGNACAHLACDAGNVAMAELCIEQLGLRMFGAPAARAQLSLTLTLTPTLTLTLTLTEKPFCNSKGRAAASLAAEGGAVHAILRRHAGERRKLHEEAEERQRQAG